MVEFVDAVVADAAVGGAGRPVELALGGGGRRVKTGDWIGRGEGCCELASVAFVGPILLRLKYARCANA